MSRLSSPLRFEPFLRPMPWGGRKLLALGKNLLTPEPYGESWEVSDHALAPSIVAEGPWAGQSLRSLMQTYREDLLGSYANEHDRFPWLIKCLDANDWLSVQVHPDEKSVKLLWPGEGPKNEAWFVLEAAPESRIFAGLSPGVGQKEFEAALRSGSVAGCLHQFAPRPGDFIFMPAGTVHAVGGGVLFAEIQQTSDATFRLFDWNRRDAQGQPRKLHIEESLACIDWTRGPVTPLHVQAFDERQRDVASPLVQSPYFDLQFVRHTGTFALGGLGQLQALCVFSGQGRLATGEVLQAGQVWVFPAVMPRTTCKAEPEVGGMLATLAGEWPSAAA